MTATVISRPAPRPVGELAPRGPRSLRLLGPNWFAAVMGTGIVANAAATLPLQFPGLRGAATVVWALAATLLVVLSVAWVAHWARYPDTARDHRGHPVMSQFFGAPPMALLTVGGGTLLLGSDVIGVTAAVAVDWVLWTAGTVLGLLTSVAIPYRMFTGRAAEADAAFGGWLMPVVPPMVSAAMGALLVPHTPAGQLRLTMILLCVAMFGLSLFAALVTITLIWSRLVHHGTPQAGMVPTLWIVLGPLGQSITAAGLLANAAPAALPDLYAKGLLVFSIVYGIATWGFAMLWLILALAITVKTYRAGELAFNLTWWGFTFPLGTCVTGSIVLYSHTGANLFAATAVALYVMLVVAWSAVAIRTARGAVRGDLLRPALG
ncbi:C4-dicarboxylate transporter/malic acid transport protein [Nocardia tenerifensis]|uniref:C4-dicarboxylate transporter/malic acid transport protein n=1 Tax=Nocardia tenerifensis TaxID=228006 RepID=A0A318K0L6_9NOCA|nr:TDT family transporter [Nocardia tenerifensis]PXX61501.1 C4-dicarboxylate transporter/malic acid transport protein [Nocardia tenerifensis]